MGNMASLRRSKSYTEVHEALSPEPVSCATPAETPKCPHILSLIDPRSPNVEISRTPILCSKEEEEAKLKAKKRSMLEFMEREAMKTPPEESRDADVDLLFDPRSPTQEISRTPICVQENVNPNYGQALSESTAENARFDDSGEVLKAARKNFDYDMGAVTGQMCRDLRKRLFITQKLNASDTELLNMSEADVEETDKENQLV